MRLLTWILAILLGIVLVFVVTGKSALLLPNLPGITLNIIILAIAAYIVYKLIQKVVMILVIPLILIALLLIYASVIVQAPMQGKVINAANNQSVSGIVVTRSVFIGSVALNGSSLEELQENSTTSDDGSFSFPWFFHITFPFVDYFSSDKLFVEICDTCTNSGFLLLYHEQSFLEDSQGLINFRFNFLPVKADVYLIPKLSAEECQSMQNKWLVSDCINLSSQ
ncbi:MAG: hypothetical protein V1837_00030 [Candidatus Woesearchaeota archaeon]